MTSLAILLAWAFPGDAAPKAKPFIPAKVGTTWVYEDDRFAYLLVITAVETKGRETVVSIGRQMSDGTTRPLQRLSVSDKGLFQVELRGIKLDTPECLVRFPFQAGDKWEVSVSGVGPLVDYKGTATSVRVEEVTVPAGKYRALRVDRNLTQPGRTVRATCWFADEVGVVKQVFDNSPLVLKSYSPAKDGPGEP